MQSHAPVQSYEAPKPPTQREEPRAVEAPRQSPPPASAADLRQTVEQSGMVWIETDPSKLATAPADEPESAQPRQRRERKPRSAEEISLVQIETRKD